MVIYKTTNLINGKYYIGKDSKNNPKYLGSGVLLKKAIIKYGKFNFVKEILYTCKNEIELNEKEKEIVNETIVKDKMCYNLVLGGYGGNLYTYEQKIENGIIQKISNSHKNKPLSIEHKNAIALGLKKYKNIINSEFLTDEEKFKKRIGKYNNFFGHKHNGDLSRFGKHRINKIPTNAKMVKKIETGEIFNTLNDASKEFINPNTARRAISYVCKGDRSDFMGFHYEYV